MATIGLIAAMTDESNALLRHIKNWKRITVGSYRGHRFELAGRTCILVTSGMGIRRAAEATRALAAEYNLQLLISFGIAGAVEPELEIGDVVAAESFCQLDAGVPGLRLPLASLPNAAREAVVRALAERGARLFTGTAITTGGSQLSSQETGALPHPILEMETAGIAQAAAEKKIPLFSLRAISDGPRAPIPFDLGEVMDADANLKIGKLLKAILHNPKLLLQASRMSRNSRIAADNAAVALIAALSNWGIE
jgi:nucleoside phosphorylase